MKKLNLALILVSALVFFSNKNNSRSMDLSGNLQSNLSGNLSKALVGQWQSVESLTNGYANSLTAFDLMDVWTFDSDGTFEFIIHSTLVASNSYEGKIDTDRSCVAIRREGTWGLDRNGLTLFSSDSQSLKILELTPMTLKVMSKVHYLDARGISHTNTYVDTFKKLD